MIGVLLAVLFGAVLVGALAAAGQLRRRALLPKVILGGYALRLVIQFFIRDVQFFSHGVGGDALGYEGYGQIIALIWRQAGIHYVNADEMPETGAATLPHNLFAFIIYLNDFQRTRLGCTAIVALAAGLTILNLYLICIRFGAEPKNALLLVSILYFQPAFLFYTSDTYKDGLVLCFTIGTLGTALRLSFRFSIVDAVVGVVCAWALWYVRHYLVFVTLAPLLVGTVGIGSKNVVRSLLTAIVLGTAVIGLAAFTDILQVAADRASETFELGTSSQIIQANTTGGSGVAFDDGGSPYGAFPQKLAYTLFAPFPWAGGSLGFQLGKIDALLWYFNVYRAVRAARHAERRLLIMLVSFIVPCTVMYAMTVANVGLIMRQRLVIVAATTVLASLYKPQHAARAVALRSTLNRRPLPKRRAA